VAAGLVWGMLWFVAVAFGVVRRTVSSDGVDALARDKCDGVDCGPDQCLDGKVRRRIGDECCACPKFAEPENECTKLHGEPGWAPCRDVCGNVEPAKRCFRSHIMKSPQGQCRCEPPRQQARREAETPEGRDSESIDENAVKADDPLKQLVETKHQEEADALAVPAPPVASGETEVEITWVRHGLSCANANDKYTEGMTWIKAKAIEYWFPSAMDPPLADCGAHRSQLQAKNLDEASYDFVGASVLLRALQTAALHFPTKTIHAVPYLSESGGHNGANKQSPNQQERAEEILLPDGRKLSDRVDYKWLAAASAAKRAAKAETTLGQLREKVSGPHVPKKPFSTFEPSMEDGLAYLAAHVLPELRAAKPDGVLRLAIVSHSIFMGAELPCRAVLDQPHRSERDRKKPRNNEALTVTYTVVDGTLAPTGCTMAAEGMENPPTLCARDVATCPNPIVAPMADECLCGV